MAGNVYRQKGAEGYVIRWVDAQGKRRGRLIKTTSIKAARESLAAERGRVEKSKILGTPLPSNDSFKEWADQFLVIQEKNIAPSVVKGKITRAEFVRQKSIITKWLKPFFGRMKLAAMRKADIIRYVHSRTGVVKDGTLLKEIAVLKHMLYVAVDLDKIATNPAARVPVPRVPEGRTRYLTPDEWQRVFEACRIAPDIYGDEQKQWLQQCAGLLVSLGVRRGELLSIVVPDIDLERRQVTVRRTKNGRLRTIYLNDLASQVFASMGIAERKRKQDRGTLFPDLTAQTLSSRFLKACRKAGVENFTLHSLRHSFAATLRQAGAGLDDLMHLMGHSDLRQTTRYAHLTVEHLKSAASRMDGVLTLPKP
jgi:integrase